MRPGALRRDGGRERGEGSEDGGCGREEAGWGKVGCLPGGIGRDGRARVPPAVICAEKYATT